MTHTIRFEHVSKQYRLGLTRTSLPTLVSRSLRRLRGSASTGGSDEAFWALEDVSFDLRKGESLALIGRNGAGKSTLLKLLANITRPTFGTITTNGQLSALIELGAGFHPDLTGRENIYLNGAILGLSRADIDRRFDEILGFSELSQFIDTPVKRYSSGMTVRLGFAVASCIEPDILLVDEVLAVGDASFQQKCLRRIQTLLDTGTSIIFVSHNLYLVQAVCEQALYLDHGRVRARGRTQEVINVYEQDLQEEKARKFATVDQTHDQATGDNLIEITNVEVTGDKDAVTGEPFSSREPVQIRVHYHAYQYLGSSHVSVFIIRSDGVTSCMLRTKLDDFPLHIRQGKGTVSVRLEPVQLVSGTYFVEAWFLNDSDSMPVVTKAGRSDWFSVKGAALSNPETGGMFEPHTTWHHTPSQNEPTANGTAIGQR